MYSIRKNKIKKSQVIYQYQITFSNIKLYLVWKYYMVKFKFKLKSKSTQVNTILNDIIDRYLTVYLVSRIFEKNKMKD